MTETSKFPYTTIAVLPETKDELAKFASYKDEKFDDILKRLMALVRRYDGDREMESMALTTK